MVKNYKLKRIKLKLNNLETAKNVHLVKIRPSPSLLAKECEEEIWANFHEALMRALICCRCVSATGTFRFWFSFASFASLFCLSLPHTPPSLTLGITHSTRSLCKAAKKLLKNCAQKCRPEVARHRWVRNGGTY